MKDSPKISFVVVARNDDYGGNFINRITSFVKTTTELAGAQGLEAEIIVVEYNPPNDRDKLHEVMKDMDTKNTKVRFIEVPQEFHLKFEGNEKNPLFEYIGKNIGVRRARGEYVVAMNPDIIFSKDLIGFISKNNIKKDAFYRANRHDVSLYKINTTDSIDTILKKCNSHVMKILYTGGTVYVSYKSWLYRIIHGRTWRSFMFCPLFNFFTEPSKHNSVRLHENAAGDFLMMHKEMWDKSGAYDETPLGSALLDGYLLYILYCLGYKETILSSPIYHIEHKYAKTGRPIASFEKYKKDTEKMLSSKEPYKPINDNWGFPDEIFKETVL